jgi:predicted nucleic acid-binding protein
VRDRRKQERAIAVTDRLARTATGAVSCQVLGEFFTAVTKRLPAPLTPAEARAAVEAIARHWLVLDLTLAAVQDAIDGLQRFQLSYWDALIWATARRNGVATVLSEDFNDGAVLGGVRFVNPFRADFDPASL